MENSTTSSSQNQGIVISGGSGGVKTGDITQKISVSINMKNLLKAMSSTTAQQQLTQSLSQTAQALTSGINLAQFSNVNANLDATLKSAIDVSTNMTQKCATLTNTDQTIVLNGDSGGVSTGNISQESVANIFNSCILDGVVSNSTNQVVDQQIKQSAEAKSEGLSGWEIAAIIGAIVLALTLPIIVGGTVIVNTILKIFFPILAVAGIVMIILYYTWRPQITVVNKFATGPLSANTGCGASGPVPSPKIYATFIEAVTDFNTSQYQGMDWVGYGPTTAGKVGPKLTTPVTTFYTTVATPSCLAPPDKNLQMFKLPTFLSAGGNPTTNGTHGEDGDFYVDITTGTSYVMNLQTWNNTGYPLIQNKGEIITFDASLPDPTGVSPIMYMDTSNPKAMTLYQGVVAQGNSQWVVVQQVEGPGYAVDYPDEANSSAVRYDSTKPWLLYTGIACTVMGMVGFLITTIYGAKTSSGKAYKPTKNDGNDNA